jgi:hypothetical protein
MSRCRGIYRDNIEVLIFKVEQIVYFYYFFFQSNYFYSVNFLLLHLVLVFLINITNFLMIF